MVESKTTVKTYDLPLDKVFEVLVKEFGIDGDTLVDLDEYTALDFNVKDNTLSLSTIRTHSSD